MNREDLLAQVNAAKRLGDDFMPPPGSVIRFDDRDAYLVRRIVGVGSELAGTIVRTIVRRLVRDDGTKVVRGAAFSVYARERFYVLEIPSDAPPFEDWPRYPSNE